MKKPDSPSWQPFNPTLSSLIIRRLMPSLRRMESFHKNIGLYREYRLRMAIIIQEMSQLYDIYGRDGEKVFLNAKVRIIMDPKI